MFVSAGFFVTRSINRPDYANPSLIPERVVTVSRCLAKFLPDTWCIEWTNDSDAERQEGANCFGLSQQRLFALIAESTTGFESRFGWPNVIWDLGFAQSIATQFLGEVSDVRVIELGLHRDDVEAFCHDAEPEQHEGYASVGRHGIHEAILKNREVSESGISLGFEPLLSDGMLSCTWLCNGLETEIAERLQICPNPIGLIDTIELAQTVVSYIGRDDVGAEPGLWLPWLIIDHTNRAEP
jgi:hypothetical protein